MKQRLCLFLLVLVLAVCSACGKDNKDNDKDKNNNLAELQDEKNEGEENETSTLYIPDPNAKEVTNPQPVANDGNTYTELGSLKEVSFYVSDPDNSNGLSTEAISHSYGVAKDEKPNQITVDTQARFDTWKHNCLTWDNKTEDAKVLYLTFDCGYEYENLTGKILDTLREKQVPAAFFCTLDYLKDAPEFATRMINEGHILGNHSTTHPSNSAELSREELAWELLGVHNYLLKNFGYESQYFRFPTGTYSENAVELVDSVGYRSIFWSIAHADWDPEDQPGVQKSFDTVTSRLHPGSVILLHACSPDNAAILGDFIDYAHSKGYEFRSLNDYAYWDN